MSITRESGNVGDENQGGRISKISTHYPEPGELINVLRVQNGEQMAEDGITHLSLTLGTPEVLYSEAKLSGFLQTKAERMLKKNMLYKQ